MGFQSDLQKVQEITEKLNSQGTDLDESIKLYEEGVTLVKKLEKQLAEAKRKVEIATGSASEGVTFSPLDSTESET